MEEKQKVDKEGEEIIKEIQAILDKKNKVLKAEIVYAKEAMIPRVVLADKEPEAKEPQQDGEKK